MMQCRYCGHTLQHPFLDLVSAPPSNAYLPDEALNSPQMCFPLRVLVCDR